MFLLDGFDFRNDQTLQSKSWISPIPLCVSARVRSFDLSSILGSEENPSAVRDWPSSFRRRFRLTPLMKTPYSPTRFTIFINARGSFKIGGDGPPWLQSIEFAPARPEYAARIN